MNEVKDPPYRFQLIGGELCLDFANTVGGIRSGVARERLHSYTDLLAWSEQAAILNEREVQRLAREAAKRSTAATAVFHRALALREAIYRMFSARSENRPIGQADLEILNTELATALASARVILNVEGFGWGWVSQEGALDRPLWPVARSAAFLLTTEQLLKEVRECQSETCGWLFLDTSKNHSRRWCDMRDCGTREKVRRHRQRKRKNYLVRSK